MTVLHPDTMITGVIHAAASAAVLAAVAWAVTAALGDRLPAGWRCGLWLLVLGRLAVPLAGPVAVPRPARDEPAPIAATAPADPPPAVVPFDAPPPKPPAPPDRPVAATPAVSAPPSAAEPAFRLPPWSAALFAGWACGAGFGVARLLVRIARLRRAVRGWEDVTDPAALAVLDSAKAEAGVRGPVQWVRSPAGPAVCGAWRPVVLLPAEVLADPEALQSAALHELAHVRRRDVTVGVMTSVVRSLWWPHPAAHLAAVRWRADRELACDAFVLSLLEPADRPAYGRLVVALSTRPASPFPLPAAAAGLFSPFPPLRKRIAAMTRFTPVSPRRRIAAAALLAAAIVAACVGPAPARPRAPDPPPAAVAGETAAFAGVVVDPAGAPLAGATVALLPFEAYRGDATPLATRTAAADGSFAFDPVPWPEGERIGREYLLVAALQGRASEVVRIASATKTPGDLGPLHFVLPPEAPLTGVITDGEGRPLAGATIGRDWSDDRIAATTGPDGRYRLTGGAAFDFRPTRPGGDRVGYARGWYYSYLLGGAASINDSVGVSHPEFVSETVEVTELPGELSGRLRRAGTLTGTVVDGETGEPVAGVEVSCHGVLPRPGEPEREQGTLWDLFTAVTQGGHWARATTDAAGRYEFRRLPPLTYAVQVTSKSSDDRGETVGLAAPHLDLKVGRGETVTAPPLALFPPSRLGTVRVRFENADGSPLTAVPPRGSFRFIHNSGKWLPAAKIPLQLIVRRPLNWGVAGVIRLPFEVRRRADGAADIAAPPGRYVPHANSPYATESLLDRGDPWAAEPWMTDGVAVSPGEVTEVTFRLREQAPEPPAGFDASEPPAGFDASEPPVRSRPDSAF